MIISSEEIIQIVKNHKLWIDSCKVKGKRAEFVNIDATGIFLEDVNLAEAYFSGSNFNKAVMKGCNLEKAHFENVKLEKANLISANLKNAKFVDVKLENSTFEKANLSSATLIKVDGNKTDFCFTNCKKIKFVNANLSDSNFGCSNLEGADLQSVIFINAHIQNANFRNANLGKAQFKGAYLQHTDFRYANLSAANFEEANIEGILYNRWGKYRGIRVTTSYGCARFRRFSLDQDFIEEFREKWWRKPLYYIWLVLSDCGRSFFLWFFWSAIIAIGFGYLFFLLGENSFEVTHINTIKWSKFTLIYYSVVTFTTLGFGDITPKTPLAAKYVMAEVILGYLMLGGLISIFTNKIARRS